MRILPHLMVGLCLATCLPRIQAADNVELKAIREPINAVPVNFPMDLSNMLQKTAISQVDHPGTPTLTISPESPLGIAAAIDSDRVTGITLPGKGEYTFLMSLQRTSRLNTITLTGNLKGVRATVQITDSAATPEDQGWEKVLTDKDLGIPVTTLQFRARPAYLAMITIKIAADAPVNQPYVLRDVGLYATGQDVREFKLEPTLSSTPTTSFLKKDPEVGASTGGIQSKDKDGKNSDYAPRADLVNVGGMYAGGRVTYVSSRNAAEQANNLNDDTAQTSMTFDPQERESVAVIDLGSGRRLNRVAVVHSPKAGQMKFYAVNVLPWENSGTTTMAQLAWLPVGDFGMEIASDVPLLRLFALADNKKQGQGQSEILSVPSSVFDGLPELGSCDTGNSNFSEVTGPMTPARYLITRFLNSSPGVGEGFRVNDINCFGDQILKDYKLEKLELPDAQVNVDSFLTPFDPLAAAAGPGISLDNLNTAGQIVPTTPPSPTPPPVSP